MNPRWLLVLLVVLGLVGWWYSPVSPRGPRVAAPMAGYPLECPPPPPVGDDSAPLQTDVPPALRPFALQAAQLQPLAGFSVQARVLSRKDYSRGRESDLSPTDLALGWGRMREDAVLSQLHISQSGRWFHYRYEGESPLPAAEINRSAANMHLIPSTAEVARALREVRAGDEVRVDGWLVEATTPDGWRWRSSTSRTDTGQGACELVYVCAIARR